MIPLAFLKLKSNEWLVKLKFNLKNIEFFRPALLILAIFTILIWETLANSGQAQSNKKYCVKKLFESLKFRTYWSRPLDIGCHG